MKVFRFLLVLVTLGSLPLVTPAQNVPKMTTTTIPVGDLIEFPNKGKQDNSAELIQGIIEKVAPKSWASAGGMGTLDYYPLGLSLVVNNEPAVLKEVEQYLDQLRKDKDKAKEK